jgi:spore maturation protein CgeB
LGSYVPDGIAIGEWLTGRKRHYGFYDIDTPVTLAGLDAKQIDYISAGLIPRFDLYLSFSGGPALGIIEDLYGSPLARALYCSADLNMHVATTTSRNGRSDILAPIAKTGSNRSSTLLLGPARQLQHHSFVVAGAKYPEQFEWPDNVAYIPHLPPGEHPEFYCSQRYTLNVTRPDMKLWAFRRACGCSRQPHAARP